MTQETPSRSLDKIIARLPDGMRDRLKNAAEENNRSVNAEVVHSLSVSLGADAIDDKPYTPSENVQPDDTDLSKARRILERPL